MDGPTSIWDIEEGIYKIEDRLREIIETEAQKGKKILIKEMNMALMISGIVSSSLSN